MVVFTTALLMAVGVACSTTTSPILDTFNPKTFTEMSYLLLNRKPELAVFADQGPFTFQAHKNLDIRISLKERINADLFLAEHAEKAPLVIFVHGNGSFKEAHSYQAMHVASWGMHSLVVQLPNYGRWMQNGKSLERLVSLIFRWPDLVGERIDTNRLLLVGHSFGGSAVCTAVAAGAPVRGVILLDPAVVNKEIARNLQQVNVPVMVLGADEKVFASRKRDLFFKNIRGQVAELSIKGATHEDAQYPSEFSLKFFGFDPFTSEDLQQQFVNAIALSAFSLSATGKLDYAWAAYEAEIKSCRLLKPRRK